MHSPLSRWLRALALSTFVALSSHAHSADLTLRQAGALSHRLVGSEVEAALLKSDPTYTAVVKREFSVLTPQNEMKWGWISHKKGQDDFSDADSIVAFAKANGMKVRGHTLVWYKNLPKWLTDAPLSPEELRETLVDHIQTEVTHFRKTSPGTVFAWDVVNEAVSRDGSLRSDSIWAKVGKGADYLSLAFKTARAADPQTLLFYNDFSIEEINAKSNAVYTMLSTLKAQGVPIDGIGFQMHLDSRDPLDIDSVRKNFERFASLGLKIHITEFDYAISQSPTEKEITDQAKAYHDAAALCVSLPACQAFVSWGFTDAHSWIPGFFPGRGHALYFDESYHPKRACEALLSGLRSNPAQ